MPRELGLKRIASEVGRIEAKFNHVLDSYEVTLPWFWNYFQKHFLVATKQDPQNVKRCLHLRDFGFMIQV